MYGQEERRLIMELSDLRDSRLQRFVFGQSNVYYNNFVSVRTIKGRSIETEGFERFWATSFRFWLK